MTATLVGPARLVLYVAAPLAPTADQIEGRRSAFGLSGLEGDRQLVTAALQANLERAMRWLAWLRRSFPEVTFVAPWIAAIMSGEDDSAPAQREAGLVDADAVIPRLDGIVLVGGRISSGMARERGRARRCWDLTGYGAEPPDAAPMPAAVLWSGWAAALEARP